jgi:hypothetical protein
VHTAPAQIAIEGCAHRLSIEHGATCTSRIDQGCCSHDDPGKAVAALAGLAVNQLLLDRVRLISERQAFDGGDALGTD